MAKYYSLRNVAFIPEDGSHCIVRVDENGDVCFAQRDTPVNIETVSEAELMTIDEEVDYYCSETLSKV